MKQRAIDLQLVKPVMGKTNLKGKITLRNLQKELLDDLNVAYADLCCVDEDEQIPNGAPVRYSEGQVQYFDVTTNTWTMVVGGGVITADNGLNISAGTNVQLGGSLLEPTVIAGGTFNLNLTGNGGGGSEVLSVDASGGGHAIAGEVIGAGTGIAIIGRAVDGYASYFEINPASTTGIADIMQIRRSSSGTATNGIAGAIRFQLELSNGTTNISNKLVSTWTDVVSASRTSEFKIRGVNTTVEQDLFTLSGNGALRLNKYGVGSFPGVPVYALGVDANGNVVEFAP